MVVLCLAIAACHRFPGGRGDSVAPLSIRGIAYGIDTTVITRSTYDPSKPDAAAGSYRAFQTFVARVVYANGRGRLDVLWVRPGPPVRVDSAALSAPVAHVGDYYLFDSTGFILVRPATRSFLRAASTQEAFGGYEDREGWPKFFEFQPPHLDTVIDTRARMVGPLGPLNLYWHTDSGRTGFARGRTAIADVPFREMNVARWFGPSRWLAHVADSAHALPGELTVTTAVPFRPSNEPGVPRSFILKQAFSNPTIENVELSLLVLPRGYVQMRWTEDVSDGPQANSPRDVAHWFSAPHVNP
jgi:hypothetical protein